MVSSNARQRLRQMMHSVELADEIINLLDVVSDEAVNFVQSFGFGDWVSGDDGDIYFISVPHNLNTLKPEIQVFENNVKVDLHKIEIIDANNLKLFVSNAGSDARFSGKIIVDV